MLSGYERSPGYSGLPWRPQDEIVWIVIAAAVLGDLAWLTWA